VYSGLDAEVIVSVDAQNKSFQGVLVM